MKNMMQMKMGEIKMMDKSMSKFIYAFIGLCSIIIPGPIVPIVCLVVAIGMLVMKIKAAKQGSEGFEMLMFDIIGIAIVLVISVVLSIYRISLEFDYMKHNYSSSSSSEDMTVSELAEAAILVYKIDNMSQFESSSNNINAIKNGFKTYLQKELEIQDVKVNKNKITCTLGTEKIIFTVTKNDITFSVE